MNNVEIILVVGIVCVLIWDVFLYTDKTEGNSITQITIKRSKEYPIIPFLLGFLIGHFYG